MLSQIVLDNVQCLHSLLTGRLTPPPEGSGTSDLEEVGWNRDFKLLK